MWVQIWGQGTLELSADSELVRAESWGHDLHLHFLYLSFPEAPPGTDSNMETNVIYVFLGAVARIGAVAVIGAVVAVVRRSRRRERNTGRNRQSPFPLSFL